MSVPIVWFPRLRVDSASPQWALRLAESFWDRHEGYGHVVFGESVSPRAIRVPPDRSAAFMVPEPGFRHRRRDDSPKHIGWAGTVEWEVVDVTSAPGDPLENPLDCDRLVLHRRPDLPLGRLESMLSDLLTEVPISRIWLDLTSTGWDAATWLLSRFPQVQLEGVADHELWRLMQIAQWLNRPLWLQDAVHPNPREIPQFPRYLNHLEEGG